MHGMNDRCPVRYRQCAVTYDYSGRDALGTPEPRARLTRARRLGGPLCRSMSVRSSGAVMPIMQTIMHQASTIMVVARALEPGRAVGPWLQQ